MNLLKNKIYGFGFIVITAIVFGVANNSRAQSRCDNRRLSSNHVKSAVKDVEIAVPVEPS
jgi:hypothetical protein